MKNASRIFVLASLILVPACASGEPPKANRESTKSNRFDRARRYFAEHCKMPRLPSPPPMKPAEIQRRWKLIQSRPDPGTSFESFIYGIGRRKSKLLSDAQISKWDKMLARHSDLKQRLHDERNTIRVQCLVTEWDLAKESDVKQQAELTDQYDKWLGLHLDYVFEELIAHQRFREDAWSILTPAQRQQILDGKWDQYVNKSTGHKRLYSVDKVVTRALGPANQPAEFEKSASVQRDAHQTVHQAYAEASERMRRLTFAMDLNTEPMVISEWANYKPVFRAFFLAQRDDLSAIVRQHYEPATQEHMAKTEAAKKKIESKVHDKYVTHAVDLVRLLYGNQ